MGILKSLNRWRRGEERKSKAFQLSKALQLFYASHAFSPWQTKEVEKIRKAYETSQLKLNHAHDLASSHLSEQYMQLELDTVHALHEWRQENPNQEWVSGDFSSIFKKAFWKNLMVKAGKLGVTFTQNDKAEAK